MSTKKIRVLLFPVEREPKIVEITPDEHGSTLTEMQALVGGYVECVPVDHHLDLWCNENGKLDQLPLNRPLRDPKSICYDIVAGPCFLARSTPDGDLTSVTDEDIEKWSKLLLPVTADDINSAMSYARSF